MPLSSSSSALKRLLLALAIATAVAASSLPRCEAQEVIISEFLALNDDGLVDEDGDSSDWIELLAIGGARVDLGGWFLTDDAMDLQKWELPAGVSLGPGDFLLVFASGKDRAVAGSELHASFELDGRGEFLALVRPDGVTVEHAWAPAYPPQREDISFGLTQDVETTTLVPRGATARVLVPADGSLGTSWTLPIDDSAWAALPTGIGFETADDTNVDVPVEIVDLAPEGTATQSSTLGGFTAQLAIDGDFGNFSHTQAGTNLPATWELDLGDTFAIESVILHNRTGCCGSRLRDITVSILDGSRDVTLFRSALLNPENVLGSYPNGPPTLEVDLVELTGAAVRGQIVRVVRTPDPDRSGSGGQGNNDEPDVLQLGEVQVFGQFSPEPPGFGDLIRGDIEGLMHGSSASAYLRLPFDAPEPDLIEFLELRMRYDDGFVAYLNGVPVARRNAPASPGWGSRATAENPDEAALAGETINISEHRQLLAPTGNILAVHGLNLGPLDTDFLILPELTGRSVLQEAPRFFGTPTPGRVNGASSIIGFVEDTKFSVDRGFFNAPFDLAITTATEGARIRLTLDGTPPSPTRGTLYTGPIRIDGTTTVRAIAFADGLEPTNVDTHTYLFVDDIVRQDRAATLAAGLPSSWGGITPDYGMDPDVIGFTGPDRYGGRYNRTIRNDLLAIPTMSIVMDVDDLFGSRGIYSNSTSRGVAWERPCSVELIVPDGVPELQFQEDCGIRIQGGAFRSDGLTKKHSLRLLFKEIYGATKLRFPLFGPGVDRFDTITLRAGANDGYAWNAARLTEQYTRDEFGRELQRATGNPAARGIFVHLYLNGIYWGLYNPAERPDHSFSAQHLGGDKDDWDSVHDGSATNGDTRAWSSMLAASREAGRSLAGYRALQGLAPDGTRDPRIPHLLDVPNYVDYLIVNVWGGNWDWPWKNWWAGRDRTANSTGFKFYCWDYENTIGNNRGRSPLTKNALENNFSSAGEPHQLLRSSEEYRLLFADRIQKFLFHGGVLTPEALIPRYRRLADHIERAMVAESARWGDTHHNPPLTLAEWEDERDWILGTYLPQRTGIVLGQFRGAGLYPPLDPPTFSQHGGRIAPGFNLVLRVNAGTAYYTLDTTDPRLPGGDVAPDALVAGEAIASTLVSPGAPARVLVPTDGSLGLDWIDPDFDDGGWRAGTLGVGYERNSGYEDDIGIDVEPDMFQQRTSVYVRVRFTVDDPSPLAFVTLRMKYDDGFVAYINGRRAASQNAPANPSWDDSSTGSHEANGFESFDVGTGLLRAGENVLAIHGLNSGSSSSDMLVLPELVASGAAAEEAIVLDRTTRVRARALLGSQWSALDDVVFAVDSSALRITELMYHPPPPPRGSRFSAEDFEFIEFQNIGETPLNLTGIRFGAGVEFTFPDTDAFPELDLRPGEIALIVRNLEAFESRYNTDGLLILGEYTGRLRNGGEFVLLGDRLGETLVEFVYSDQWYPDTDGLGRSLEIIDQTLDPSTWADPASWTSSADFGGSPGTAPGLPGTSGQIPGDINQDRTLDVSDAVALLRHLFVSPRTIPCDDAGTRTLLDVNGDAGVSISDAIYTLEHLFLQGPAPALGTACVEIAGCADACGR